MGLFDKIKQTVSDTVSDISSQAETTLRKAKEQTSEIATKVSTTASELAAEGAKSVGQGLSSLGQSISDAGNGDYTGMRNIASATGDFIIETAKDMSGINAYNHYNSAKQDKEKADEIVRNVESEVGKVRYLASERLEHMGNIRLSTLKSTVGRFIKILDRMNQGVRDKEYELLTNMDVSREEIKEMESIAIDHKQMSSVVGIGITAATVAGAGAQKLAMWGVSTFASASTGTAIKNLSGAAARKATMAWLGGGSVSAGGGGMAVGASRMAMLGRAATGIGILTTVATVASIYYSKKHTEATQYLADIKVWEAKTMAACELMKLIVRRSDEIANLTIRLETRCSDALDSLDKIAEQFDPQNVEHVRTFQQSALLVKSMSQLCHTPLIDENGELNGQLNSVTLSSEKILNKEL